MHFGGGPDYVPEEAVAEVDDLLKPAVRARMKKTSKVLILKPG